MPKSKVRNKKKRGTNEVKRRQGAKARQDRRQLESYEDIVAKLEAEYDELIKLEEQPEKELVVLEDPSAETDEEVVSETIEQRVSYTGLHLSEDISETVVPLVHYVDGDRIIIGESKVTITKDGEAHIVAKVTNEDYFSTVLPSDMEKHISTNFNKHPVEGTTVRETAFIPSFSLGPVTNIEEL